MTADELQERLGKDPTLAALETGGRPTFVVGADGGVVWAGAIAGRLLVGGGLDASARRALARMAGAGAGGLVRLRLGSLGALTPLAFRARPLSIGGAPPLLALESLAPIPDRVLGHPRLEAEPVPAAEPGQAGDSERAAGTLEERATGQSEVSETSAALAADDFTIAVREPSEPQPDAVGTDRPYTPIEPFHFVFEIDADERLAFVSPDLGYAVGSTAASALGRTWADVSELLGLDPERRVAEAIGRRGGWGDIEILWPLADGRRLPISLSALPMFDRGRSFVGFRGLGRSEGDRAVAATPAVGSDVETNPAASSTDHEPTGPAPSQPDDAAAAAIDPHDRPTTSREDAAARTLQALFARALTVPPEAEDRPSAPGGLTFAPPTPAADTTVAEDPPAEAAGFEPPPFSDAAAVVPFHGNVVPLRDVAGGVSALSSSEESAFDEIARRLKSLGVRVSDEPPLDTVPGLDDWTIDDVGARAPAAPRVEDLLRLLDRLPVGALVLRAGEIAYANRSTLDMLGHPDLVDLASRGAEGLFAEPLPRDDAAPAAIAMIARDGIEIEVEARLAAISWGGAPATLVSLKRAEGASVAAHAAIKRERETSAILDAATDGVLVLDASGRILSVNQPAQALFGFEGRDVIGSLFTLSLAPESRRIAFDYLDDLRSDSAAGVVNEGREVLGLARHGGAIPLHLTISRVGAHDDDRFCAVLRDVTPWKRAEEELLAAKRQAERANAQKTEFLAKVSREIRAPLNAIIGFADLMTEERFGPIGSPRYKDCLRDIHTAGRRLVGLVNDLLDITRIETGGLKLDPSAVDLNEIAQQAAALLQPQASRDHVIIRTSLARGLPPVLADRRSVRQIFANLASNAVRLSRPGGQVIVATALTDIGQAVIRVRDAGVGMTKQELARALESFRPLGLADNDGGGDLGLPLTKALAEANDAGFVLKSELGHGTLAEVTFPASRVLAV